MGDFRDYDEDVQRIKYAILRSQYETGRVANSNQLALYYGIGGYVSANTRSGKWGTGALASIGDQLQKELPGLRGFSECNLKYMRTFFEEWEPLFGVTGKASNSAVAIAEFALEEYERKPHEALFIGIVLCKNMGKGLRGKRGACGCSGGSRVHGANWEAVLASASACIVFLDEDVSAAKTPEFARRVRESDNY